MAVPYELNVTQGVGSLSLPPSLHTICLIHMHMRYDVCIRNDRGSVTLWGGFGYLGRGGILLWGCFILLAQFLVHCSLLFWWAWSLQGCEVSCSGSKMRNHVLWSSQASDLITVRHSCEIWEQSVRQRCHLNQHHQEMKRTLWSAHTTKRSVGFSFEFNFLSLSSPHLYLNEWILLRYLLCYMQLIKELRDAIMPILSVKEAEDVLSSTYSHFLSFILPIYFIIHLLVVILFSWFFFKATEIVKISWNLIVKWQNWK